MSFSIESSAINAMLATIRLNKGLPLPTPGTERTQAQTIERIRIHSRFLRQIKKEFKN